MSLVLPWSDPLNEHEARLLAVSLCEYACNGSHGRPEKGDSVYDAVTEGRDFGKGYSSCADLAHWMLFCLGVRLPLVNRKEHLGWRCGVNLSRLAWCEYARTPTGNDRFAPGDILTVWNLPQGQDGHVCVVIHDWRVEFGEDVVETANYGAPGGAIRTSTVRYGKGTDGGGTARSDKGRDRATAGTAISDNFGDRKADGGGDRRIAILGRRRVQRWVPLYPLLEGATAAGKLVDAQDPTRDEDAGLKGTAE